MSKIKKIIKFCNENTALIAGVGIIIGIHWMWDRLQHLPYLVPEKERRDLPIIKGAKYLKNKAIDQYTSLTDGFLSSEQKNDTKND